MHNHGLGMDSDKICENSTTQNAPSMYLTTYSADLSKSPKTFGILLKKALIRRA